MDEFNILHQRESIQFVYVRTLCVAVAAITFLSLDRAGNRVENVPHWTTKSDIAGPMFPLFGVLNVAMKICIVSI